MGETGELPFQPIRGKLYSSRELMRGFDPGDNQSISRTPDFESYVYFVLNGRAAPKNPYAGMMQALHDNSILRSMYSYLDRVQRPAVAIMGGHKEERGSPTYRQVTRLAKRLTEEGFIMASGGGPGCMEATHLGALLSQRSEDVVERVISKLATVSKLPASQDIVSPDGIVNQPRVAEIHEWAVPAFDILQEFEAGGGASLAVPTWHYGHEPISPLATDVAKYFLNSIREDVLLALATNGIVFSPGRAGTLQEVFQDAAQNYYAGPGESFAPMIFWDKRFWTDDLPVRPLLEALFVRFKGMTPSEFEKKILFTDSIEESVAFLRATRPSAVAAGQRLKALGLERMSAVDTRI